LIVGHKVVKNWLGTFWGVRRGETWGPSLKMQNEQPTNDLNWESNNLRMYGYYNLAELFYSLAKVSHGVAYVCLATIIIFGRGYIKFTGGEIQVAIIM
jgi:hypothetical protein